MIVDHDSGDESDGRLSWAGVVPEAMGIRRWDKRTGTVISALAGALRLSFRRAPEPIERVRITGIVSP